MFILVAFLVFIGYVLGALVSRSVPDELEEGAQIMLLVREGAFLTAITVSTFILQFNYWFLIPFLCIIGMYLWKSYEKAYPFLLPILIFVGTPFVVATTFVVTFLTGVMRPESFKRQVRQYGAFVIVSVLLMIFRFFQ